MNLALACSKFDENMSNWLEQKLEHWRVLEKTRVFVSDSAANMLKMMEYLPDNIEHVRCLNHIQNTVVEN